MREPCGVNIGGDGKIPPPILRCRWSPNECGLMLQMDLGEKKHDVNGFRVGVWGIFLFFSIPISLVYSSIIPLFLFFSSPFLKFLFFSSSSSSFESGEETSEVYLLR